MKKNVWLFRPMCIVLTVVCLLLTGMIYFADRRMFPFALVIMMIALGFVVLNLLLAQREVGRYLNNMGSLLETAQNTSVSELPLPICMMGENGEILWYNKAFRTHLMGGQDVYGQDIYDYLPSLDPLKAAGVDGQYIEFKDRLFTLYSVYCRQESGGIHVLYFVDDTEMKQTSFEYQESRLSVMLIIIDNYEELMQNARESEKAQLLYEIEGVLEDYISSVNGYMIKTARDKFTAIVEERYMRQIVENKFDILDKVRAINSADHMPATLSIGVGRGYKTLQESESVAKQALDMSLGRGGDQAAVRSQQGFEFYGGVSKGIEKRTKVKTRIVATALSELIESSDNVIIMGHHFADLDCFGAAVGLLKGVRLMGKPAVIAIRRKKNLVVNSLQNMIANGYEDSFVEPEQALGMITKKTMLVIVDTHVASFVESPELYKACNTVVVIDHHRKMVGHIDNAVIFYHEPYASSASEMVTELLQYFDMPGSIGRPEAEALLAGIMLDTKNFVVKTGVRTFEAAAYLRRIGADTVEVRKLFASTMESYQKKTQLVASAEIYRRCAIAYAAGNADNDMRIVAPQAADELLGINDVDASFTFYEKDGEVAFSARSMGAINVQIIMEQLGGGGHHTMAGAQIKNITIEAAKNRLLAAIDDYYEKKNK